MLNTVGNLQERLAYAVVNGANGRPVYYSLAPQGLAMTIPQADIRNVSKIIAQACYMFRQRLRTPAGALNLQTMARRVYRNL